MFSSLASFLFGSNTNCETNSERTATAPRTESASGLDEKSNRRDNLVDDDNLIEVTSLTPSVQGAGEKAQSAIKRGRNKRNNARQQNKRNEVKTPLSLNLKQAKVLPSGNGCDVDEFDEGDWFIVEKEEEQSVDFPVRNDSEEENAPVNELVNTNKPVAGNNLTQQRRHQQHSSLHSSYSGPRPQKQRNFLQKSHNNSSNRPSNGLSVSTLSPSRTVNDGCFGSKRETPADGGVTQSLCLASTKSQQDEEKTVRGSNDFDAVNSMEESWFVTPPPCFTSIGPINMETSPYENLLIEHPSMSVYHSIKMAQEATDNFVKLDISINDLAEEQKVEEPTAPKKKSQAVQPRNAGLVSRFDRQTVAQMKQEFMARNVQKIQTKHEQQDKCRSAFKRTNKVRDVQSRNHVQRRSDRQYSKFCSNASNNRKTNCY